MLLFRSEEIIERWCTDERVARGEVLTIAQVWKLARLWYADRISPDNHGRTAQQAVDIFREAGLTSSFWSAPA